MSNDSFRALVLDQRDGAVSAAFRELQRDDLPAGDVLVAVAYSTLNYKDGLAVTGTGKIARSYPMVPGIDFAGTVVESASPDYKPGDQGVLTGGGVGERHWGGFAQMARVKSEWLVPLPAGLTMRQAMGIGTAGFTAMLGVMALEDHGLQPGGREVLVTGAAGGLGSIAVAVLAKLGHRVAAATGRAAEADYLKTLGATEIVERATLAAPSNRPLDSERWGGAVDSVGGDVLAGLLRSMALHSSVAVCGNAGGPALNTTVFPLILRGVNMLGIDSVMCPGPRRRAAWERLARDLPLPLLEQMMQVVPFDELPTVSQAIIKGQVRGRIVIDVNA
jgi:acrylyl-CoA reductase (NADPH)